LVEERLTAAAAVDRKGVQATAPYLLRPSEIGTNLRFRLVPRAFTAPMITIESKLAMITYSMEVAPRSSLSNRIPDPTRSLMALGSLKRRAAARFRGIPSHRKDQIRLAKID
jgi:hypothetical protein